MVELKNGNEYFMALTLPWPPSANSHWRSIAVGGRPRVLISKKGREYRKMVGRYLAMPGFAIAKKRLFEMRLKVEVRLYPPDKRRRDIDNHVKPLLDALAHGGAFKDDEQIDVLQVYRMPVGKPGRVCVMIQEEYPF